MYFLLGIDDTDAPTDNAAEASSNDTAELAATLGKHLESRKLAQLVNLSSHQLFQHPSIPHTSQNIACCLLLDAEQIKAREIELTCREILHRESAPRSNPGFALAAWNQFDPEIVVWGKTAKFSPLNRQDGIALARRCSISVAGIEGSGAGIIGALAAVGLRYEGNDGWISWMPGLASLNGIYTEVQLTKYIRFDRIESERLKRPAMDDRIQINSQVKPLIQGSKIVLRVTNAKKGSDFEWHAE